MQGEAAMSTLEDIIDAPENLEFKKTLLMHQKILNSKEPLP